ncbi:uncharacterized protein LOC132199827 [Neocloeon triangulifer]|uniref:uncharacterized protein LOC132199827 n=1 Tax=Neocloeon triangulifer TaxID=2078957 RepID=UPI00286F66C5|nr:uncharacterized protein LOC132199827 [Neocloeon triangulifer]
MDKLSKYVIFDTALGGNRTVIDPMIIKPPFIAGRTFDLMDMVTVTSSKPNEEPVVGYILQIEEVDLTSQASSLMPPPTSTKPSTASLHHFRSRQEKKMKSFEMLWEAELLRQHAKMLEIEADEGPSPPPVFNQGQKGNTHLSLRLGAALTGIQCLVPARARLRSSSLNRMHPAAARDHSQKKKARSLIFSESRVWNSTMLLRLPDSAKVLLVLELRQSN